VSDDDRPFRVHGTIREEESGAPIPNLLVRAFDRDFVFDDTLGETTTDGNGAFQLHFTQRAFRDLREEWPDLYLRVYDRRNGRQVFHTRRAIRWDAGPDQRYDIVIRSSRLGRSPSREPGALPPRRRP
jgi:hypothetical protein